MKPHLTDLFVSLAVVDELLNGLPYEPPSFDHEPGNDTSTLTAVRYFAELNHDPDSVVSLAVKTNLYALGLLAAGISRGGRGDYHYVAMARELVDTAQRILADIQRRQDDIAIAHMLASRTPPADVSPIN